VNNTSTKDSELKYSTHVIELSELKSHGSQGAPLLGGSASIIHGVKVRLRVSVGQATMTLGELLNLKEGSILKLESSLDLPVDVLIEDKVVARGQLVAVDDNFGVRITEPPKPLRL
jgi:flagellar motor switch protein FliN/FliY